MKESGIVKKAWVFWLAVSLGACQLITGPGGRELFRREGCVNCHSFKSEGGGIGPDLTRVTASKSEGRIREHIRSPRKHDPESPMPSYGHLSDREMDAIMEYLKTGAS